MNTTKNNIRLALLKKLKRQKEVERLTRSFRIQKKLFSLPEFIKAKIILFYLSFNGEVETLRMIEKAISLGKKVAVPVTDSRRKRIRPSLISDCGYDLEVGAYGIPQPKHSRRRGIPLRKIDLVVVPAVAF
ncbi:5-formyltetrahydrofolate cyclo-ligase, partial [Candidatus Omnitrophota bacterium]